MDFALTSTLLITCVVFTGIWLIHVSKEDAGVIDFYWGPGFFVIGAVTWLIHGPSSIWHALFLGAIAVWAIRLTWYLGRRHMSAENEDGRYREMRDAGGPNYWWTSLFKVFLLQAVILWIIAAPVHVAMRSGVSEGFSVVLFSAGIVLFVIGFVVESVADAQLSKLKAHRNHRDAAPQLIEAGLWARSRHPNYLGEMILWWGLGLCAFTLSGSFVALIGPALLTAVMVGITIPLTEAWLEKSRPAYDDYRSRVPILLPKLSARPSDQRSPAE